MSTQSKNLRPLTQLALLVALQAILTFTPLGFIMIPPISITILHIPVIIGGILLGYRAGATLGGAFGLFSMVRAATSGIPGDIIFNPFASGNPLGSLAMALLPRILLGLAAAALWQLLRSRMKAPLAIGVSAAVASLLHSFGVLALMALLFRSFPLVQVFAIILGLNCVVELVAAVVVSMGVCQAVLHTKKKA